MTEQYILLTPTLLLKSHQCIYLAGPNQMLLSRWNFLVIGQKICPNLMQYSWNNYAFLCIVYLVFVYVTLLLEPLNVGHKWASISLALVVCHLKSSLELGKSLLTGHRSLDKNLLKKDVERELLARSLHPCLTAYYTVNKADLDSVLTQKLKGIQTLPAILLAAGDCPLQNLNCEMYEVPNMEFMHDMCNIVEHVMCEMPYLESSPELASFIQTLSGDQRKTRAVDARRFIVKLCFYAVFVW